MKKYILAITMMTTTLSQAQVVISEQVNSTPTNSSVLLEFGTQPKGIILPSVESAPGAVGGTFIVNKTDKAVQYYNGTVWVNLTYPNTLVENPFINGGTSDLGEGAVIGAATSTKPGVLVLESTTQAMVLPRVTNPHLNILSPVAGTMVYDTTSDALAVYDGTEWSYWAAKGALAPTNPTGSGSLSGKLCFDVAQQFISNECGTIESRAPNRADFSQTLTNTQKYTFKPTGTVSNVRFMYYNANGQVIQSITPDADYSGTLTSAQTAIATVVFYNNLNTIARGLSRENALFGDIYVVYNDGTGDKQLKLTAKVQDCACCGAMISATQWKEFLCHNLGADTSLDPHTPTMGINGAYIAWGRRGPNITGDSRVDWQTAPNNASQRFAAAPTAIEPNAGAISGWSQQVIGGLPWSDTSKTVNDPCPQGYRVPTIANWTAVIANNSVTRTGSTWTAGNTNYSNALHFGPSPGAKTLTLPAVGVRHAITGALNNRGLSAYYSSSSVHTGANDRYGRVLYFTNSTVITSYGDQTFGSAVRCIAE